MESSTDVTQESLLYRCGWSPFMGHRFKSRIAATIVNGEIVWDGNAMCGAAGGQRLKFNQKF
jgi:dihydroorotase